MSIDKSIQVGKSELSFSAGYLAKQADGAVTVSYGETVVFATAVAARSLREGQDFFPLTVDYREKFYAAGKIPGGFIKRESRPSDRETLTCRLTDRPLRPLFPKDFLYEVQIIIYVLSHDKTNQPDVLAINAASAALSISGMPFKGPVGAVRAGRVHGEWVVNPTFAEAEKSDIDVIVAGTKSAVTMIEGSAKNVSEEDMLKAVEFAHEEIKKICVAQEEFAASFNKPPLEYTPAATDEAFKAELKEKYYSQIEDLTKILDKKDRENGFKAIVTQAREELAEKYPDSINQAWEILDHFDGEVVRKRILEEGTRADGRGLKDIRPIDIITGNLPRAHGSAVFTRGQTQVLSVVTLGAASLSLSV